VSILSSRLSSGLEINGRRDIAALQSGEPRGSPMRWKGETMTPKVDPRILAQGCRARASHAGFPPLRRTLMDIADHYELDAYLVESSLRSLRESRHLIAAAEELLRH
jgi:hypothetical protein